VSRDGKEKEITKNQFIGAVVKKGIV